MPDQTTTHPSSPEDTGHEPDPDHEPGPAHRTRSDDRTRSGSRNRILTTAAGIITAGTTLAITRVTHVQSAVPGTAAVAALILVTVIALRTTHSQLTTPATAPTGARSIGIGGLTGTAIATTIALIHTTTPVLPPALIPIINGTESLTAITAGTTVSTIIAYEYYRPTVTHAALTRINTSTEDYNPEFIRHKTTHVDDTNITLGNNTHSNSTQNPDHNQNQAPEDANQRGTRPENTTGTDPGSDSDDIETANLDYPWTTSTDVDFDAVGGMQPVKQELRRDVIAPLTTRREQAEALGVTAPNIIFYGPPGTGKSFIAQALASELGLPFVKLSGADIQSKWINESSQKVKDLFEEAQTVADQAGGAVVFLDELDSVLRNRGAGQSHEEDTKVVNEFLNRLENTDEHNIVFIGATNRLDALDNAGIRSGRIDKKIKIGPPDHDGRTAVLEAQLDTYPHDVPEDDIRQLASKMDGYVPADIERVVENAAKRSLHHNRDAITTRDIHAVLKDEDD